MPTTALAIATERDDDDIVTIIREAEARRTHVARHYGGHESPLPRELKEAIDRGDEAAVIEFLESYPPLRANPALVTASGPDGITLLHLAAARLLPRLTAWLLARGADVHRRSGPGFTPIDMLGRWPIAHPHDRLPEVSQLLLEHGAERTAFWAIAMNDGAWLRARHAEGTLQHPGHGDGLLSVAVEHDRADMLRLLLELGFDADERKRVVGGDEVCETRGIPLERAASKGRIELARLLLEHGADPNGSSEAGGTPMSSAYRRRDQPMLELLARHGGVVSAVTAAYHGDIAIARERIQQEDAGRLPPGGVTPGRTVAEDLLDGDCGEPEIIRMALARIDWAPDDPRWYAALRGPGAFWSYVPWIESPLWQPNRAGYLESFRLILARGHANVRGSFGRTILHDVMAMGHHDGASGWITEDETLAFAVTLLDAGARTDVRDELLESTPLGWACRWGRLPIIEELLRRGVDPTEPDARPWATPRAWAQKMGHRDVLALLDANLKHKSQL